MSLAADEQYAARPSDKCSVSQADASCGGVSCSAPPQEMALQMKVQSTEQAMKQAARQACLQVWPLGAVAHEDALHVVQGHHTTQL